VSSDTHDTTTVSLKEAPIITPFQDCYRMTLRLRPDIYDALKRSASCSIRSMNGEINELLRAVLLNRKETNEAQLAGTPSSVSDQ